MPHFWQRLLRPNDFWPKSRNICFKFVLLDSTFDDDDDDDDDDDGGGGSCVFDDDGAIDDDLIENDDDDDDDNFDCLLTLIFSSFFLFLFNLINDDVEDKNDFIISFTIYHSS